MESVLPVSRRTTVLAEMEQELGLTDLKLLKAGTHLGLCGKASYRC